MFGNSMMSLSIDVIEIYINVEEWKWYYNNRRLKISYVNDNNVIWLLVIYKGLIIGTIFPLTNEQCQLFRVGYYWLDYLTS